MSKGTNKDPCAYLDLLVSLCQQNISLFRAALHCPKIVHFPPRLSLICSHAHMYTPLSLLFVHMQTCTLPSLPCLFTCTHVHSPLSLICSHAHMYTPLSPLFVHMHICTLPSLPYLFTCTHVHSPLSLICSHADVYTPLSPLFVHMHTCTHHIQARRQSQAIIIFFREPLDDTSWDDRWISRV